MIGEPLNQRWETLLNSAQQAQAEAQETLDVAQAEYRSLKMERDQIGVLLGEIWPSTVLRYLPVFWKLGLQTWRETPDEWRADYVAKVRAGLRSAQGDFERSLDRQAVIPGLRLREKHQRVCGSIEAFTRSWLGIESQIRDFLHALDQARGNAQWLSDLPLPQLRRPRGWLAQRIPLGRAGTDYDASKLARISRAGKYYKQATEMEEAIRAWISPTAQATVQWEKTKVDFYRALVPLRPNRLRVLATQASDCLMDLGTPAARMMLDVAEMFWLTHQLTPGSNPGAPSTAAYWFRQCAATSAEPGIRALAATRLNKPDLSHT
jgi:hypothetical protein